jgi:hypothetical protein
MAINIPDYMICQRCPETKYHVHGEQLSDGEHYALNYALAVTQGGRYAEDFKRADAVVRLTASDKRRILADGLRSLNEKWGLVSLARGPEGTAEPAEVHANRFVSGRLILGDGN